MKNTYPLIAILLASTACSSDAGDARHRADLATVIRGPLRISVTETASIRAAKETRVKNQMEGSSTVIYLIEEGSMVEKGEKLVELDASQQIERRASQEIAVEKANAAVINAGKNLEILREQVKAANQAAKNNLQFAGMDQKKFYGEELENGEREMGEQEQSIKAEEAEIDLAKSALKLAEDRFNWSVKLREKDFITQDDLDKDRLDWKSKETRLTLAINKLAILKKYTHKKTERELDQKLTDAGVEHRTTVAKGEAQITQAVADFSSKQAEQRLATERLQNLRQQIESALVLAPTPGIVVYAAEGDRHRRRYIENGANVRERQNLIILPDVTHMQAELSINEAQIDKVEPGQKAVITIDTKAAPLAGVVLRRAPLPDSQSRYGNPDLKVYKTLVDILGNNEDRRLHPNMGATVEIIVDELPDVLSIPIQAINTQGAVSYVWVETSAKPEPRKVVLGDNNNTHVVVTAGLEEGEQVYLVAPIGSQEPQYEQPKSVVPAESQTNYTNASSSGGKPMAANGEGPGNHGDSNDGAERRSERRNRGAGTRDDRGRNGGGRGAGGRGGFDPGRMAAIMKKYDDFKKFASAKNPGLGAQIEAAGQGWRRNEDIKKQIEADPELAARWQKIRASFRRPGRREGSGRRQGSRGRPGGAPQPGDGN